MATTHQQRSGKKRAPAKHDSIRVGTASWSDPGFIEDWYPSDLPARERLRWYAEHFDLVEVNSTFYAVPAEKVVARWCDETPEPFLFDVKLHKFFSRHSTPLKLLPAGLRKQAKLDGQRVVWTPELEEAMLDIFLEGIQPLYDAGKMGALLLQLSPGFRPRTNGIAELDSLVQRLENHSLAIEFRNRDWLTGDHRDEAVAYCKKHGVTLVQVDSPASEHFTVMPSDPRHDVVTNPELAYLRAHGRNVEGYVRGRTVADRFDHVYSDDELHEIAERTKKLSRLAAETHVIFNNNKSNYAPKAAARFREMAPQG